MKISIKFFLIVILIFNACKESRKTEIPIPTRNKLTSGAVKLEKQKYYDKVLGALVGSAIGDAMGASTEMWHRSDIQNEFGYINGLEPVTREKSAEGIWTHNLDSGATTDDTRWKFLMVEYLNQNHNELSPENFADFIVEYYQSTVTDLSDQRLLQQPDLMDDKMMKLDWIKEWARVALAFKEGGTVFEAAKSRFYGGEMSCAGLLYTPMFGLVASDPLAAYEKAYSHTLFDIGYAKDISSIAAAMTQLALYSEDLGYILKESLRVDPHNYMNSRLIGRLPLSITKDVKAIIRAAKELIIPDGIEVSIPSNFQGDTVEWEQQQFVYKALEKRQKSIAFHAGEIWEILYASLVFGEGDFLKTMQFIVNYGRDNDTVAAIAGLILGAKDGYSSLPDGIKQTVLQVNKEHLGIDLELMASRLVDKNYLSLTATSKH